MLKNIRGVLLLPQPLQDTRVGIVADAAHQTQADNLQIQPGFGERRFLYLQQIKNRIRQEKSSQGNRNGYNQKRSIGRVDGGADPFRLSGAVKLSNDHCGADAQANEQRHKQKHHRKGDAHRSQRRVAGEIAHGPTVHHIVELLEHIAQQQRQRKQENMFGRTALRHIPHFGVRFHIRSPSLLLLLSITVTHLYCIW